MNTKIIYFVHGTTYDNINKKCSGWKDITLTELGRNQAINLGRNNKYKFDELFTSDLIRAVETATLAFPNMIPIKDKRLRECNYGDFDGAYKSKVVYEEHISIPFNNGESLLDVEARIRDFCEYLKENFDGKTVAVVAHKAPQLALDVITKGCTWQEAIDNDWRKHKAWQPGWEYIIK